MSGNRELVTCENDTVTPKRKCHPEAPDVEGSNEPVNEKITAEFNDMCDDVIDMILCLLQLQDLVNISDTSVRLKAIAGSVFSRRHVRQELTLILIDAFHYSNHYSYNYKEEYPIYCRYDELLRVANVKIWFQLVRNFGGYIKHVRIQSNNFFGISIPNALVQFVKSISEFCSNTLETFEVAGYSSFTLEKPLTKLQTFIFHSSNFENPKALEFMPNLRDLSLHHFPSIVATSRNYAKLKRVELYLNYSENAQTFISFVCLNPQIKYLSLSINYGCVSEQIKIYCSIADNLTQLETLKLFAIKPDGTVATLHFKTVKSFSICNVSPGYVFEFDDLKELTLQSEIAQPSYLMNLAKRNRKLKILTLICPQETFFADGIVRNALNELPELEQIIVLVAKRYRYSIFKDLLGDEWKFATGEIGKFKSIFRDTFESLFVGRFRKINSKI